MNRDALSEALKQLGAVQLRRQRYQGDNPHVVVYIGRSKNNNVVVYEAKVCDVNQDGRPRQLAETDAIHPYWMRAETPTSNTLVRQELGFFEKKAAYGVNCTLLKNLNAVLPSSLSEYMKPGEGPMFTMVMTAFKKKCFYLCMHKVVLDYDSASLMTARDNAADDLSSLTALEKQMQWLPVMVGEIGGKSSVVEKIWVQLVDGTQDKWIPTVAYIDIWGALLSDAGVTGVRERFSTEGASLEVEFFPIKIEKATT